MYSKHNGIVPSLILCAEKCTEQSTEWVEVCTLNEFLSRFKGLKAWGFRVVVQVDKGIVPNIGTLNHNIRGNIENGRTKVPFSTANNAL